MDEKQERQSSTCCRDYGTKEQESKGREVVVLKLLVKYKLLYSERLTVETPKEREQNSLGQQYFQSCDLMCLYYYHVIHVITTSLSRSPHDALQ